MFEKEIKFIVDYTLNKLRKEVAHINMGRLLNSSIHPAIIKYCSAEIDNQIKKDRNKLLTDSLFDYSGREIARYFSLITEEIKKNYKMKGDDLKKLIIKSVSFNANYVVRPGWTLTRFIFHDEKERTIKDIITYFDYVYYYQYQIKVLSAFLQKRKTDFLSKDEFIALTSKIDKELVASNRKEIVKDGITSIADFFNEGALTRDKVSPSLIEAYLKDKKMPDAAAALRNIYPGDDKQKQPVREILIQLASALMEEIDTSDLTPLAVNINEDIAPGTESETLPQPPPEEIITEVNPPEHFEDYSTKLKELIDQAENLKVSAGDERKTIIEEEIKTEISSQEDIPGEADFARDISSENDSDPVPDSEAKEFSFRFYVKEDEKIPEESNVPVSPARLKDRKNDIFSYLSKKEIDRIVESVFTDDQNEFASTMDKITDCDTYDEAAAILKDTFKNFRVNPYSKDAVIFTSAVANYFNQD